MECIIPFHMEEYTVIVDLFCSFGWYLSYYFSYNLVYLYICGASLVSSNLVRYIESGYFA